MRLKRILLPVLLAVFVVSAMIIGYTDDNKSDIAKEVYEPPVAAEKTIDESVEALPEPKAEPLSEKTEAVEETVQQQKLPEVTETPEPITEAQIPENTCTISIRCDTILHNMDKLNPDKVSIIPADGTILAECTAVFESGQSVFDLTLQAAMDNGIHMEFEDTPMYDSMYIEGIANLYEFDCGDLSGWIYKVNGKAPNVGCSKCVLQSGDIVEWVYTCDLGRDV